jgi:hypothetical protein
MGNTTGSVSSGSSLESSKQLKERLNLIATEFIISNDFKNLKMLVNETYCDNLTILTKDILSSRFNAKQIKSLAKTDTLFYISKQELQQLEANEKDKKNIRCKQIAKFYVRIAHLFASIITTVYPNWSETSGPDRNPFSENSFCTARINALAKSIGQETKTNPGGEVNVNIQPTVCSLYSSDSTVYAAPGFAALEMLYYDEYDEKTGAFSKRSGAMQLKYDQDLSMLYEAFTGNSSRPPEIKSFSDIKITALAKKISECSSTRPLAQPPQPPQPVSSLQQVGGQVFANGPSGPGYMNGSNVSNTASGFNQTAPVNNMAALMMKNQKEIDDIKLKAESKESAIKAERSNITGILSASWSVKKNNSFQDYASHIKMMIFNSEKIKAALLGIIDKMFLIVKSETGKAKITIHPSLTSEVLDQLVTQTRDIIIQLYLGCERDFYKGIKLLRVIIENKMQETMEAAITELKNKTRADIKKLSKEHSSQQADMDRNMRDAAENARQEFRNPIFDTALRNEKNEKQRKQYEEIKKTEFEIKELKQQKEQLEKDIARNEETRTYYESQGTETPTAIGDDISKAIKAAEEKIEKIERDIKSKSKNLEDLKKEQLEDY